MVRKERVRLPGFRGFLRLRFRRFPGCFGFLGDGDATREQDRERDDGKPPESSCRSWARSPGDAKSDGAARKGAEANAVAPRNTQLNLPF